MTRVLYALIAAGLLLIVAGSIAYGQTRDDIDTRFRTGMTAVGQAMKLPEGEARTARLGMAVAAFHGILVERPDLVRVRLELARTFFLMGEDSLARTHFETVLAGKPPEAVAANVQRFLQIIRARRRWQARFGMAVAPDSNLNTASGARTVVIDTGIAGIGPNRDGVVPLKLDDPATEESGLGFSIWGGGEYQHPLGPRLRLRAGSDASLREYKGGAFDSHTGSGYLGPRWLIDARTEASLLATVQRQWSAGRPQMDQFGLRLEAEHRLTPRVGLYGRLGARRRNYRAGGWFDGPVGEAALGAGWVALPTLRLNAEAGHEWVRPNAVSYRNAGPEARLNASLALPLGFTLGAGASWKKIDYRGHANSVPALDGRDRRDRLRTLSVSVHNRAVTVFGFSPRLSFINETRETNAQTLGYERNRGELSFVRLF